MANPLKPITEEVAEGVWRHGGDLKQGMNIYILAEDDGSVTLFDGGTASMTEGVRAAAEEIGPIKRMLLGHGHADHRGVAPALGVPVLCHEDERADTEGDGGYHYFDLDLIPFRFPRAVYPKLLRTGTADRRRSRDPRRGRRDLRLHGQALPAAPA